MSKRHNILEDTFCIYCQVGYGTPGSLQSHVYRKHKYTMAWAAMEHEFAKLNEVKTNPWTGEPEKE